MARSRQSPFSKKTGRHCGILMSMNTTENALDPKTLERLHAHHLQALLEADRLCRRHGLRYFLLAGTLLGAVRHHGPIPWDDDLDIGLLREDYERFLHVAGEELDGRFFLQANATDPGYFLCYAKLRVNGTRMVEANAVGCAMHQGVYIDVFPLDAVPDGTLARWWHKWSTTVLIRAALARSDWRMLRGGRLRHTLHRVTKALTRPLPLGTWLRWTDRAMARYKNKKTTRVVNLGGSYGYERETLKRAYFDDTVELDFAGHKVCAPARWHELLTDYYGDYMTPPPESQRHNRHQAVELDL